MARIWNKHKQTNTPLKRKVFVGLSGGVDSSVSAALLKKAGYDVTGVFIKVWQPDFFECGWRDDRLDAMRVCAKLEIPFMELNLEKEYKKEVVDYMIREYKAGKTPNPDVMCNRFIKFGKFYDWAIKNGADLIATGHYARIVKRKTYNARRQTLHATRYTLHAGLDSVKDQSYFLWQIRKEQLPYILFPVGGMRKQEVRKLAKRFGLITADKKDSQGLCFVGKIDMKEFLGYLIKTKPGKVLDETGKAIGEHDGAFLFTLGERRGFRITDIKKTVRPHYIISKNVSRNTITASEKMPNGTLPLSAKEVSVTDCNWVSGAPPLPGKTYGAQCRYRQPLQKCFVFKKRTRNTGEILIHFDTPQDSITAGQSLVLYDEGECLGGGIIQGAR